METSDEREGAAAAAAVVAMSPADLGGMLTNKKTLDLLPEVALHRCCIAAACCTTAVATAAPGWIRTTCWDAC
jgi:hypothetical protein